jgi:hypothetical protein
MTVPEFLKRFLGPGAWREHRRRTVSIVAGIVIVVLAVLIAVPLERGRRQARAIKKLCAAGATAIYDYQTREFPHLLFPNAKVRPSIWSNIFGIDACHNIVRVQVGGIYYTDDGEEKGNIVDRSKITDDDLVVLKYLPQLKELDLTGCTSVTDVVVPYITHLRKLERLSLLRTNVTDKGVSQLQTVTTLRFIDLPDTDVTRETVAQLKRALPKAQIEWSEPPREEPAPGKLYHRR